MALKARVWTAGKVLLLVGALAATYLLFAVGAMRIALRSREVAVPDFSRLTVSEATELATSQGLDVRVDEARRPSPEVPADQVLGQDPPAGTSLRQQRAVRIWLSAGARAAEVPALSGETERSARVRLAQVGLGLSGVSEIRSDAYSSDVVVAQEPPAKAFADQVSLLVNRGEFGASYVMPDLIGVNGESATAMLRNHGFRVAVVASAPYPGVPAGVVLRQNPQAGFQIAQGDAVSIEVSR
ncbi:MAG: PASTA domain-containing protein [Vicinamibacterales bacterium]